MVTMEFNFVYIQQVFSATLINFYSSFCWHKVLTFSWLVLIFNFQMKSILLIVYLANYWTLEIRRRSI